MDLEPCGYGHLIKDGENFNNGITVDEANVLLKKDLEIARSEFYKMNLALPNDWQNFMILMVFQLGITKTKQFKKMIKALKACNWSEAINQARDSNWYRQTPNRVNDMIKQLKNV